MDSANHRKAREDWLVLIQDAHEGYVSWERAEAIRKMVSDNVPSSRHHGVFLGKSLAIDVAEGGIADGNDTFRL
ncbi:probable insertion sequence transposase protein [Stappia aggregata IAM 12614]|uniref:Probable insertion sequence transposase protein n=1 Tax=Roseibium aggregatum (strain ATCC 25650 / DSM 13394 / JCM 20685 / NBRC 16684 / NCIMB 2208 / IAM 12614 / B1) TaxID=384765 RepID=A0P0U8_ROSAI|nr:transposase [Roseibium aggregatum]EAV41412.1 probable insertion sequence transposase protein [Stappia aggregata IAM 12614] [Roseibium aggregatum IAM 12614]